MNLINYPVHPLDTSWFYIRIEGKDVSYRGALLKTKYAYWSTDFSFDVRPRVDPGNPDQEGQDPAKRYHHRSLYKPYPLTY